MPQFISWSIINAAALNDELCLKGEVVLDFFWLQVGLFSVLLSNHLPHFAPTLLDTIAA